MEQGKISDLLEQFEAGMDPGRLDQSVVPARVLGYGEISTVFQIGDDPDWAYKRMPLFRDRDACEAYIKKYRNYCRHLVNAGLKLPPDETAIVEQERRPVVLYIKQKQLPHGRFAHNLINNLSLDDVQRFLEKVVIEIKKVWEFNRNNSPNLEVALDGQLSNWVIMDDDITYIDTSTPLYRIEGQEQLDPELFLQSAPSFLRWLIRWLFLEDVMNRYYDLRQVYMDLAANLYKEQRPDLVPLVVGIINEFLTQDLKSLEVEEVKKYYREDKRIWTLFLTFRKLDRWIKTQLLRQRYEFILPGPIIR